MNAGRISQLVAIDALGSGAPMHVALSDTTLPSHPPRQHAARAAEAGRLDEALSLLGVEPLVRAAAVEHPPATPAVVRAVRALPTSRGLNAAFAISASYLMMVLLLELGVAVVLQAKVLPVLNRVLEDTHGHAAMPAALALLHDLAAWGLGGLGWIALAAIALLIAAVLFAVQRPDKTAWARGDLRDLHDARVAAVAGALETSGVSADRIAAFVAAHAPSLQRQLAKAQPGGLETVSGWSELSSWLVQRAFERNARWVRRTRIIGGALVLFVALLIASSVFTVLPSLGVHA